MELRSQLTRPPDQLIRSHRPFEEMVSTFKNLDPKLAAQHRLQPGTSLRSVQAAARLWK